MKHAQFSAQNQTINIFFTTVVNKIARFKKCEFLVEVKLAKANTVHLKGHPWYYKYEIPVCMDEHL